jgi:superfamily II DNA/RNA helicase
MTHHVLHIERDQRLPILVDLTSASGRTVVFTRTKHGAKGLARQLNRNGVPAVELHGNLGQNARTRNLDAFHDGTATVLVATDIAARGIHVDDVALVIHADPPAEHKAYLHRSGRTARAGNHGTVVTLMTSEQAGDVRDLTKAAGIRPTLTKVHNTGHPVLSTIAPGERVRPGAYQPGPTPGQTPGQGPGRQPATAATASGTGPSRRRSRRRGRKPSTSAAASTSRTETPAKAGAANQAPGARPSRKRADASHSAASHSAAAFSAGRR